MMHAPTHARASIFSFALWFFFLPVFSATPAWGKMMGESALHGLVLAEQLEFATNGEHNSVTWDMMSWVGSDWNRIWLKTEGEASTLELAVEGEAQILYSRLISPFCEIQVGLRGDLVADSDAIGGRGLLVLGLHAVAPYWLEVDAAMFVSHKGDSSVRVGLSHDLFVTQRLIAQSGIEINAAVQGVPEFNLGPGINDMHLGFRLRYELARELAPYLGVSWKHTFAQTARLRMASGESSSDLRGVVGIRFWL
jgi:copper resistance protein B